MSDREDQDAQPRKRMRLSTPDTGEQPAVTASTPADTADQSPKTTATYAQETQLDKEIRAGITAYVNPHAPGFTGILKQRYTDFLVNEILPSGQVLHLESLDVPQRAQDSDKRKAAETSSTGPVEQPEKPGTDSEAVSENGNGDTQPIGATAPEKDGADQSPEITLEDTQILHSLFGEETTAAITTLYRQVLAKPGRKPRDLPSVKSNAFADKEQRTSAHLAIRRIFSSRLETTTENDGTFVVSAAPPRDRGRRNGGRNQPGTRGKGKLGWDELGGEYLHFTLYKENKDTMEVIYYIASQLKYATKHFGFAGTKDRRAVTVQRVSVYRARAEELARIGKNLRAGSKIGDYKYELRGLELGDLAGNEFVITLRDCRVPGDEAAASVERRREHAWNILNNAIASFKSGGYINYYGLQRFGSFATSTDAIGVKLLQSDLKGAIDLILDYSPAALAAAQADASSSPSTELISHDDKARAEALHIWRTTSDASATLAKLPRKFAAESNIIKHLGFTDRRGQLIRRTDYQGALQAVPRNLRLMYVHAYQSLVWNNVAGRRWERFGQNVVDGDLVLVHEHRDKEDGHGEEEEVDQAGEVIIRPAAHDQAAGRDDEFARARPLSRLEAESGKYTVFDVVLPLPGWDVEYPPNEIGEFYKEFMASERGGGLDPNDMRRKWKDVSLSGGYRKLLGRPGKVEFEVKEYEKEEEQMVETDWERLVKRKEREVFHSNAISKAVEQIMKVDTEGESEAREKKIAVVLKMQLASSQYATMALRELMKAGNVQTYKPDFGSGR
ncbi:multisubstrate pseudouridine synthase 7 [Coniosporium apollinis]|uniref:Multisubstrate pseudouridine synthase 7 n=1 Tax=Coniosporium apollinis TaxID=61459 RepID=A0ABQ9P0R1_9PEZI|nr:multisubstrate pseudouridine synthase 7 [Coniosporium apollinis]